MALSMNEEEVEGRYIASTQNHGKVVSRTEVVSSCIAEVASSITCDISEFIAVAGLGVASLLITEGESSAELDGSSLPPLVVEGKILVLASFKFFIVINRYKSQVTQRIELCSPATAPEISLDNPQV